MRLPNFALSFDHFMAESISKLILVKFVYCPPSVCLYTYFSIWIFLSFYRPFTYC